MGSGSTSASPSQDSLHQRGQPREVERLATRRCRHVDRGVVALACAAALLLRALLRALLAVEHVGARDFVLAGAHQRELDLVLDVLDVERAALGLAAHQRADHVRR